MSLIWLVKPTLAHLYDNSHGMHISYCMIEMTCIISLTDGFKYQRKVISNLCRFTGQGKQHYASYSISEIPPHTWVGCGRQDRTCRLRPGIIISRQVIMSVKLDLSINVIHSVVIWRHKYSTSDSICARDVISMTKKASFFMFVPFNTKNFHKPVWGFARWVYQNSGVQHLYPPNPDTWRSNPGSTCTYGVSSVGNKILGGR